MLLTRPLPVESAPDLYWRRVFPGDPEQARAARDFLRTLLPGHACLDEILLAADELVVNAIQHTRSGASGGSFRLDVHLDPAGVTVAVTDQGGPKEPGTPQPGGDLAESGRGLALVTALAARWRWSGDHDGRTITAHFPAP